VPGDETIAAMGGRVLDAVRRQAREHPGQTIALRAGGRNDRGDGRARARRRPPPGP
jgi:hypothetical protein